MAAEIPMSTMQHPTKFLVREYLERRARDSAPPPTPEEIRRQLGWGRLMPDFKLAPARNCPHQVLQADDVLSYLREPNPIS
jgi:hypothetical protein